jgi:hypothetical protein
MHGLPVATPNNSTIENTMKLLFTLISLLALTTAAYGQANTNVLSEVTINVNSSTNLNADTIRVTVQSCNFDAQTWVPVVTLKIEAYANDVDNGATNRIITRNGALTMTANQLKALLNAPDPRAAFKSALLTKIKLTEK